MKLLNFGLAASILVLLFAGCNKDKTDNSPKLIFKFKFDPTQQRLNNFGIAESMKSGHAGQNPTFNTMSAHYIELAPGMLTQLGAGNILYRAEETTTGGSLAIDFEKAKLAGNNEVFFETPISKVTPGDYEYLRVSLAYQNFDVNLYYDTVINYMGTNYPIQTYFPCTVASFVGFNNYIKNYNVKSQTIAVNGNRAQGYWGFEATGNYNGVPFNYLLSGQAPAGATTVVNPINATSTIPAGSCLVTGAFNGGKL